jgi:uncharacterized protein
MTPGSDKPRPEPRGEEQISFDAAARGQVGLCRCRACGRHFLPRVLCPFCWTQDPEIVDAAGTGALYSFTVLHRAGMSGFENDVPYVVALVELDEGVRMVSNVVGVEPEAVEIGMRLRAVFADRDGVSFAQFVPATEPGE